ncbi:hypothetical protein GOBAR_DD24994 [Gossypium barbadense]|nr:hypothetical protein GOBAR_DD24994 [Gossypium barbadense]
MAAKPLTSEAIALTEKKMDMTLDDIIKMSKNTSNKSKKQPRIPNKIQRPVSNAAKDKALKVRQYMDSRASVRQGVLAQRRSNFQGNRFPFVAEAARRAAVAPFRNRAFNSRRVANLNKPSSATACEALLSVDCNECPEWGLGLEHHLSKGGLQMAVLLPRTMVYNLMAVADKECPGEEAVLATDI